MDNIGVKHCFNNGREIDTDLLQTQNTKLFTWNSQSKGDKVFRREGNSPDSWLRFLNKS